LRAFVGNLDSEFLREFWWDGYVLGPLRNISAKQFGQIPHKHKDPPLGGKIEKTLFSLVIFRSRLILSFLGDDLRWIASRHPRESFAKFEIKFVFWREVFGLLGQL
jgi:hypothetical protein